ncbi:MULTISPECIES: hypothetical protein [unclassified Mycobacterium]|nr:MULTISPECIES: hypothetical protein [unclassified Mycobacterium]
MALTSDDLVRLEDLKTAAQNCVDPISEPVVKAIGEEIQAVITRAELP